MSYCYSIDEEHFEGSFVTREEAEAEARSVVEEQEGYGGGMVWTGILVRPRIKVNAWHVVEQVVECVEDQVGEYCDDWPEAGDEQIEDLGRTLTKAFDEWLAKHALEPRFHAIEKVVAHPGRGRMST